MDRLGTSPKTNKGYARRLLIWGMLWHILIPDGAAELKSCKQTGTCVCEAPDGTKADLSPLDGHGYPMFSAQGADSNYYEYNPCSGFTDEASMGDCTNVAGCQETSLLAYYPVGDANSATFMEDDTGLYIQYTSTDTQGTTRTTNVRLPCDPATESKFSVPGETTPGSLLYEMSLTTKYACVTRHQGGSSGGLSPGSVMLILLICALVIYLVAGILFNKYRRGASGVEVVPNVSFWRELPVLIKEGSVFTVTTVRQKFGSGGSYDSI